MNNFFKKYNVSAVFLSVLITSSDSFGQAASTPDLNVPQAVTALPSVTSFPDLVNYSNTTNRNYVRQYTPQRAETNTANITLQKLNAGQTYPMPVTTTYFDGLGRPLQEVERLAVNANADMMRMHTYDAIGRETYQYLPYSQVRGITRGQLLTTPLTGLPPFYQSMYPGEHPYAKTETDNSPLNKVTKVLAPGKSWIGSNRGATKTYGTNTNNVADRIQRFTIGYSGISDLPSSAGVYASNMLYATKSTDEDGKSKIEYRDRRDKLVAVQSEIYLPAFGPPQYWYMFYDITYYVYDDLGRLRFTITPEAYRQSYLNNGNGVITAAIANGLCYRYWYDERGRLIEKKLPGKEAEYFVHDTKDRPVLYQDGNMRVNDVWKFTIYDVLNRPVGTGMVTLPGATRADLTTDIETGGFNAPDLLYYLTTPVKELTNITITNGELYTITRYDNYDPNNNFGGFDPSYNSQLAGFSNDLYVPAQANHMRGAVTHNTVRVNPGQYTETDYYYDNFGRIIQQRGNNFLGGSEVLTNVYDFSGMLLGSVQHHENPNAISPDPSHPTMHQETEILSKFIKEPTTATITGLKQNINQTGDRTILLTSNDGLNRLQAKNRMGLIDQYGYNIRGWLTGINDYYTDWVNAGSLGPFFGEKIAYDKGFASKYYNGNISGIVWRGAGTARKRSYGYEYDYNNRLTYAEFRQWENNNWTNIGTDLTARNITYDYNGNIKSMLQRGPGNGGPIDMDDMTYSYTANSNQLAGIVDNGLYGVNTPDFKDDPNSSSADYTYDFNGNLQTDANKGITVPIAYSFENKPEYVEIDQQGRIFYQYDGLGNKLQKTVLPTGSSAGQVFDYVAGFEYKDNVLQSITHPEGRYRPDQVADANGKATYKTDFFVKDHLGNVRTVINAEFVNLGDVFTYTADLEIALANTEGLIWGDLDGVRDDKPLSTDPADMQAAALNGSDPERQIGTTLMLRVMPGDKFIIDADNYYEDYNTATPQTPNEEMMESLLTTLMGGSTYSGVPVSELPDNISIIQNTVGNSNFPTLYEDLLTNYTDPSFPMSHLNYLVIGEDNAIDHDRSGALQANSLGEWGNVSLGTEVEVTQPGYLLVFTSGNSHSDVLWDRIRVRFYKGNVIEENHYYPFGLTLSQASANPNERNNYKLTTKELQSEFGLNWYDFGERGQDMQIGRWNQIDRLAEKASSLSLYAFNFNNPVRFFDPNGAFPWSIHVRSFISTPTTGGGFFAGDSRGASFTGTSRVSSEFIVDPSARKITQPISRSSATTFFGVGVPGNPGYLPPNVQIGKPNGANDDISFKGNTASFNFSHSGKDPITPQLFTPALDVHAGLSFNEDLENGILTVTGSFIGDQFPSTEAFITDQSGKNKLFLGAQKEKGGIGDLFGDNKENLFKVNMQIRFNDEGNFISVQQGETTYSVYEWNKKIQEDFAE